MRIQRALFLSFAFAFAAQAKPFKTQFMSLQLPPNWDCKQEELDWVCQPDNLAERSEAIVIIVTKASNEVDDTLDKYEEVLKQARPMRDLLGNSYESTVKYVRKRDIKGTDWVDALQLGAEIPGFYTRYVAAVKEKIAGMITYSVAESVYPKYAPALDQMIDTVEIFFDPQAYAEAMKSSPGSLLAKARSGGTRLAPTLEGDGKKAEGGGGMDITQIVGILLAIGAVGYLVWKKRHGGASKT